MIRSDLSIMHFCAIVAIVWRPYPAVMRHEPKQYDDEFILDVLLTLGLATSAYILLLVSLF